MTEPLSLVHPLAYTHRVSIELPAPYFAEVKAFAKDTLARHITRMAENYGAEVDPADIVWVDRGYEFEGIWAGKRTAPILLIGGPLSGNQVGVNRDRRGVPALHWLSGPEWFPPGGNPLVYGREGIDPTTGQWHYRYAGDRP